MTTNDTYKTDTAPVLGEFLFTTTTVAARIIVLVALLVLPTVVGTFLFPEGTAAWRVCRALPASMAYGLIYGTFLFLAGKLAAVLSRGRFGGISVDLAFLVCAAGGFAYAMVA